jgi:hypothetical protein
MRFGEAFPSKYLKSDADVPSDEDMNVTIKSYKLENLGMDDDKEEKLILYFRETEKGLVLNKTNGNTICKILGTDDLDGWIGKRITLFSADVEYKGEWKRGIRVRPRAPKAPVKPTPAPGKPGKVAVPADDSDIPFDIPKAEEGDDDGEIAF